MKRTLKLNCVEHTTEQDPEKYKIKLIKQKRRKASSAVSGVTDFQGTRSLSPKNLFEVTLM